MTNTEAPFPWLALLIVFYTTHLLLLAPSGDPKLAWSVPASEVSAVVERRLMGPFYLLGRYMERDSPRLYNFESSALGFRMMESAASTVYTLHEIETVDLYNLSDSSRRPEDPAISNAFLIADGKATFVDGLSCAASSEVSIPVVLNEMADEASLPACRALGYWGRTIFDTTDPFVVSGATVSFDGRWMLLRLTKQPFAGRDYVYLIDLKAPEELERFPL